jgi:hypothetical protein
MTNNLILRELSLLCFTVLYFLFFAGAPTFILSGLKMQNEPTGLRLTLGKKMLMGLLGGIAGEITAIAVFPLAESMWCKDMFAQGPYCDGQGPLVLIFTIPGCAILGSCTSMVWTWYSLHIPANKPWASAFSYRGGNRVLNIGFAVAVQVAYWAALAGAVCLTTRNML